MNQSARIDAGNERRAMGHSGVLGRMLIDGELVASNAGEWMTSIDPANGTVLGGVPTATRDDVDRAVAAAEKAQVAKKGPTNC